MSLLRFSVFFVASLATGVPALALEALLPVQESPDSDSWITLFDGSSTEGWEMVGPGRFVPEPNGTLRSEGGMGLLYYAPLTFRDFVLEVEWKVADAGSNSGVFVRFPRPATPEDAVEEGHEIQILDAAGATGALYRASDPLRMTSRPAGAWNAYRIEVRGQRYRVYLNGELVNDSFGFAAREGHIGLQNHDGDSTVWFRSVRVLPLEDTDEPESLADFLATADDLEPIRVLVLTTTHGFRHYEAIDTLKALFPRIERTTEFDFDITEDVDVLSAENLARYDVLFFANSTLRLKGKPRTEVEPGILAGSFGRWDIRLESPQGVFAGVLSLSGQPGDLEGHILIGGAPQPSPLTDVLLDSDSLSFRWDTDQYGSISASLVLEGDSLGGRITSADFEMGLRGGRVAAPSWQGKAGVTPWVINYGTPTGTAEAILVLRGDSTVTGGFLELPSGNRYLLHGLRQRNDQLAFYFIDNLSNRAQVRLEMEPYRLSGTVSIPGRGTSDLAGAPYDLVTGESEDVVLVNPSQQQAILDFLAAGKGIAGAHAGLDAFYAWDEYRQICGGGLFRSHPWTQPVRIAVEDATHPAVDHMGDGFWLRDEIYVLDANPRPNSHVLTRLDMSSVDPTLNRADPERMDYPISWVRTQDGGRIFYTKIGHFADVWTKPIHVEHLLDGLRWAAGR